jgi:hypothetical protein
VRKKATIFATSFGGRERPSWYFAMISIASSSRAALPSWK